MENMENVAVFNSQHYAGTKVFSIINYVRSKKQNMQEIDFPMQ